MKAVRLNITSAITALLLLPGLTAAQDDPQTLPESRAPVVRTIQTDAHALPASELTFTAREHPHAFVTAFERRFGEPLEGDAATWKRINYQPWGVEDVTVRMNVIRQAGDAVEVRFQIDLPEGLEDHDAAMEDIPIWFQRLVNATVGKRGNVGE